MSTCPSELLEEQAELVLTTLDAANAATLYAFAEGLRNADESAARFWLPVCNLAANRERGDPPDGFTLLVMRGALRDSSRDGEFIDSLETAESAFWQAVRDALVAIRDQEPVLQ